MVDVGFREAATPKPAMRREEPTVAPPPDAVAPRTDASPSSGVIITPPPRQPPAFGGETAGGEDALGIEATLRRVGELAAHARTATPLTIGLFGGPGSGRSFALHRSSTIIRELAAAAGSLKASPFLSRVHIQPVDAAALDGDIASGLAATLHTGLRRNYPDLAREIAYTARDPGIVLRELGEKLDDARRRLDSERRALDEAGSRRARLTETVLFDSSGSQVDAYARANRASIERRLAGFGVGGDPVRSYKELVQYVASAGGRVGLTVRALWAFKGQTKLIVAAIVLALVAVGLGMAIDDQASWLGRLRSGPQAGAGLADWMSAHIGLLASARTLALALAALAIVANVFRAFAFLAPIFKGARLLGTDIETRRHDLDGLFAHGSKRVDTMERDVERLSRDAAEAEKRAGAAAARFEPSPFATSDGLQANGFFASLTAAMAEGAGKAMPQRIVFAVDHLDALPPERARAVLDVLHRAAGAGVVSLVAADAARLDPKRNGTLERWVQIPVRLAAEADDGAAGALVARLLGRGRTPAVPPKVDASASALDAPVADEEADMLAKVAPLAGATPRAARRFVTLYRLARAEGDAPRGALAYLLALRQSAAASGDKEVRTTTQGGLALPAEATPRMRAAFEAARGFDGTAADPAGEAAASRHAARWTYWA